MTGARVLRTLNPEALAASLAAGGVGTSGLELLRSGTNDVFRDTSAGLIVRVSSPGQSEAAGRALALARQVSAAGAPVVGPLSRSVVPVGEDRVATVWPAGLVPGALDSFEFGRLIRRFHDVQLGASVSEREVASKVTARVKPLEAETRFRGCCEFILEELDRASLVLEGFRDSERVLTHGDAHPGNVVIVDGRLLMVDLDDVALSHPEVDFAPLAVAVRRFGRDPADLDGAALAYGKRIDWELLDAHVALRQVTMLSWLLSIVVRRPEAEPELWRRIRTWGSAEGWTTF